MNNTNCAIITGGGRGLGRAIAVRIARERPVIIIGRTESALLETKHSIEATGGTAVIVRGDINDPYTITACLGVLKDRDWNPDILVCNAGIGKSGATHEQSPGTWQAIIDTNLSSVHSWTSALLPSMVAAQNGTICLISSVAGLHGIAYDSAYAASKHALVGLGQSMALEYGKHGIAVQILCPGFIEGEMTERSVAALAKRKDISQTAARQIIAKQSPLRSILQPEEVAGIVAFLCTDAGRQLSGNPIVLGATA